MTTEQLIRGRGLGGGDDYTREIDCIKNVFNTLSARLLHVLRCYVTLLRCYAAMGIWRYAYSSHLWYWAIGIAIAILPHMNSACIAYVQNGKARCVFVEGETCFDAAMAINAKRGVTHMRVTYDGYNGWRK